MTGAYYMGLVARLPCAICRLRFGFFNHGVEVHHQRSGTGAGRRASDWRTIPLCTEHHRGNTGIHGLGTKAFIREYGFSEQELVLDTWQRVGVTVLQVVEWEQALVDRRVSATAVVKRAPRAAKPAASKTAWPKRKLQSKNTLKSRPLRQK